MGAKPYIAWTQHDYARLLLDRDASRNREKASTFLDGALGIAREIGMKGLDEKILAH